MDEAELLVGDSLIEKISATIASIDLVVAVLSRNSVRSAWVQKELSLAMTREIGGRRVCVLPVRLDSAPIPDYLTDKLWADFSDVGTREQSYRSLLRAIERQANHRASSSHEYSELPSEDENDLSFEADSSVSLPRSWSEPELHVMPAALEGDSSEPETNRPPFVERVGFLVPFAGICGGAIAALAMSNGWHNVEHLLRTADRGSRLHAPRFRRANPDLSGQRHIWNDVRCHGGVTNRDGSRRRRGAHYRLDRPAYWRRLWRPVCGSGWRRTRRGRDKSGGAPSLTARRYSRDMSDF